MAVVNRKSARVIYLENIKSFILIWIFPRFGLIELLS